MTPADEVEKCPEPKCGSTDKGTRYQIIPPTKDNPLGTYCKNPWHNPPEVHRDEAHEFTPQEFQFIFAVCSGLTIIDIAERYQIGEDIVQRAIYQTIFGKAGVWTRAELIVGFVMPALNAELRRRSGDSPKN